MDPQPRIPRDKTRTSGWYNFKDLILIIPSDMGLPSIQPRKIPGWFQLSAPAYYCKQYSSLFIPSSFQFLGSRSGSNRPHYLTFYSPQANSWTKLQAPQAPSSGSSSTEHRRSENSFRTWISLPFLSSFPFFQPPLWIEISLSLLHTSLFHLPLSFLTLHHSTNSSNNQSQWQPHVWSPRRWPRWWGLLLLRLLVLLFVPISSRRSLRGLSRVCLLFLISVRLLRYHIRVYVSLIVWMWACDMIGVRWEWGVNRSLIFGDSCSGSWILCINW